VDVATGQQKPEILGDRLERQGLIIDDESMQKLQV